MTNIDARNVAAVENRATLSQPVVVRVENADTAELVKTAFRSFATFCEKKGATTTATELRAMADNPQMSGYETVLRINSVCMVIATGMALHGLATFLEDQGASRQARAVMAVYDQMIKRIPDDWDCGDPECEACATHHGRNVIRLPGRAHD